MTQHKFLLDETRLPEAWYNINADMLVPPAPVLHPGTMHGASAKARGR
jgi:tryptophan synthase beta chain